MPPPSTGLEEVAISSTDAHDQGMLHIFIICKATIRCLEDIMPIEEQIGLHDTVLSQMHEDTFTVATDASCTVSFFYIKSSLLEEDDPAWILHE